MNRREIHIIIAPEYRQARGFALVDLDLTQIGPDRFIDQDKNLYLIMINDHEVRLRGFHQPIIHLVGDNFPAQLLDFINYLINSGHAKWSTNQ